MRAPTRVLGCFAAFALAAQAAPVEATILDVFNSGTLITDFQFDDPSGTAVESTANSADPAAPFDSDADFSAAATNGLGQFDGSGKDNTSFGSVYSDIAGISAGRVIGLFDVAWSFDESIYDSGQDEEFRLSLIADDPRSTFVTAEIYFQRTSATEVTLFGNGVGDNSADSPDVVLGSSGDLLTLIDVDLDSRVFELFYSDDDGATFLSAGTGMAGDFSNGTPRPIESARFVLNEDFSDDTLLVERFAVAFIPEPAAGVVWTLGAVVLGVRRATRRR